MYLQFSQVEDLYQNQKLYQPNRQIRMNLCHHAKAWEFPTFKIHVLRKVCRLQVAISWYGEVKAVTLIQPKKFPNNTVPKLKIKVLLLYTYCFGDTCMKIKAHLHWQKPKSKNLGFLLYRLHCQKNP